MFKRNNQSTLAARESRRNTTENIKCSQRVRRNFRQLELCVHKFTSSRRINECKKQHNYSPILLIVKYSIVWCQIGIFLVQLNFIGSDNSLCMRVRLCACEWELSLPTPLRLPVSNNQMYWLKICGHVGIYYQIILSSPFESATTVHYFISSGSAHINFCHFFANSIASIPRRRKEMNGK